MSTSREGDSRDPGHSPADGDDDAGQFGEDSQELQGDDPASGGS